MQLGGPADPSTIQARVVLGLCLPRNGSPLCVVKLYQVCGPAAGEAAQMQQSLEQQLANLRLAAEHNLTPSSQYTVRRMAGTDATLLVGLPPNRRKPVCKVTVMEKCYGTVEALESSLRQRGDDADDTEQHVLTQGVKVWAEIQNMLR